MSAIGTGGNRSGSARAALALLAATILISGCSSGPGATGATGSSPTGTGGAAQSASPPTALEQALDGIYGDGDYSKETALAAFVASFGPLPGVASPTSTDDVDDGTLAIHMVSTYWAELTDEQRAAVLAWTGGDAASVAPAAFHAATVSIDQAVVAQAEADIAARVGHHLGIPIVAVVASPTQAGKYPNARAWTVVHYDPTGQHALECRIWFRPDVAAGPADSLRFTMLHEIWHCFEGMLVDRRTNDSIRPWLAEGEAEWVAFDITNGVGATFGLLRHWYRYLTQPLKPLLIRTYDALGFFAQLDYAGKKAWSLLEPMYAAVGSYAALAVANYTDPAFEDALASSFYRDGMPSDKWSMTTRDGILSIGVASAIPQVRNLADDQQQNVEAPALGAAIADLHTTAFVTEIGTSGSVRIGDPAGGGLDEAVDDTTLDLCTASSHDCTCPPGTITRPTLRSAPQDLRVAATGGLQDHAYAALQGISKATWCRGSALNLTVEGVIGGQPYSGVIGGYPPPVLTCDPRTNGNSVHWHGEASNTHNEIGGEFDMDYGTWTIGDATVDPSYKQISIFGQGATRVYLGGISGTVTKSATGGSIDAIAANGADMIHVQGTWTCPSGPSPSP